MPRLSPEEYQALAELRYLGRKFLRFSKDFLRAKANLNPEQYEALLAIKASSVPGKLTISQLSERLQVKHHSAVNIVDRLTERKLITRTASRHDRRERHVELTPKGERLIKQLAAVHHKELSKRSQEMIKALGRLKK
jgi:DNA-binding MarR family transcriptional regulator